MTNDKCFVDTVAWIALINRPMLCIRKRLPLIKTDLKWGND
jgi:hypothetical protein